MDFINQIEKVSPKKVSKRSYEQSIDDGRDQLNLILQNDKRNLTIGFDEMKNNMIQIHQSTQRLNRLNKYNLSIDKFDKIKEDINDFLNKQFKEFKYDEGTEILHDFPLCKFFSETFNKFAKINSILYPIFNNCKKIKVNEFNKRRVIVSSIDYPISELEVEFFKQFSNKFGDYSGYFETLFKKDVNSKILNSSILRLSKSLKLIYLNKINDFDYKKEILKIVEFYDLCYVLEQINLNCNLIEVFNKCHDFALKFMKDEIFTNDNYDNIFKDIKFIETQDLIIDKKISEYLLNKDIKFFNDELIFNNFYNNQIEYFIQTTEFFFKEFVNEARDNENNKEIERIKNFKQLELKIKNKLNISIFEIVIDKIIKEFFANIERPNEDKLKEMIKFFNKLIKFLIDYDKIDSFFNIDYFNKKIEEDLNKYWNSIGFKRDICRHFVYYLDYKLKNIVKFKNRNKIDNEINKLIKSIEIIISKFNLNKQIIFRKLYLNQFIQRMINSLFNCNFTIFTNICDCEKDIILKLDEIFKKFNFEDKLIKSFKEIEKSFLNFKKFKELNNIDNDKFSIIGLPNEFNLNNEINQEDKILIPKEINKLIKEYIKFIRNKFKQEFKTDNKIGFKLSYLNSKMTLKFELDTNEEIEINCNFYQGLILNLFNEIEELKDIEICEKLKLSFEVVLKNLKILNDEKNFSILVKNGDKWMINSELKITERIKNSNNVINIKR